MGEEINNLKNKPKGKKFFKIGIVLLIIIVLIYFGFSKGFFGNKQKSNRETVVLENPMKNIVMQNTKEDKVNVQVVVKQGVIGFNENYINYLLLAMGVGELHKAPINFGNPVVEMILDNEVWSSEISDGVLMTKKAGDNNKDLIITISKEEAVKALLSLDIKQFMKSSVASGRTQLEMVAGKVELLSKGYLDMYNGLK